MCSLWKQKQILRYHETNDNIHVYYLRWRFQKHAAHCKYSSKRAESNSTCSIFYLTGTKKLTKAYRTPGYSATSAIFLRRYCALGLVVLIYTTLCLYNFIICLLKAIFTQSLYTQEMHTYSFSGSKFEIFKKIWISVK